MYANNQCSPNMGKPGMIEAKQKRRDKPPKNLDHITCNDCGLKFHYTENGECSRRNNPNYDAEGFRKKKQVKYGNMPPDGGGEEKNW